MGSTILTVIVLVVMWAVVLVPMFSHRGEAAGESVTGRLGGAVRVLTRRNSAADDRRSEDDARLEEPDTDRDYYDSYESDSDDSGGSDVERDEESEWAEGSPDAEPDYAPMSEQDSDDQPRSRGPLTDTRAAMLSRRRRTLATIVMLAIITALLALGWRPRIWVVQIGLDLLLVGYLWWLRAEARREQVRRARRAERLARGEQVARPAARARRSGPSAPEERVESTGSPSGEVVESDSAAADPADDGRWEPRPVPRPTYLDAPVHHRAEDPLPEVRAEHPGGYVSAGADYGVVALDDQDPEFYGEFDEDYPTADIYDPPRAVNG